MENNFADWKTYRNEKYGFEFKHPGTMSLESSTENIEIADNITANTALLNFGLTVSPNPNNFTPKEWYYAPYLFYEQCGPLCIVEFGPPVDKMTEEEVQDIKRGARTASFHSGFKEIEFLGFPAMQYTYTFKSDRVISDEVIFMKGSFMFSIGFGDPQIYDPAIFDTSPKEVFDKILSTFKFIE